MQNTALDKLIYMLSAERGERAPDLTEEMKPDYFRALVNVRPPRKASEEFLKLQDGYLQSRLKRKHITDIKTLSPVQEDLYLWQGDITTLKCDGIVNAANRQMLGCFCPCHNCIDNAIHTFAGVQLRLECDGIMKAQGYGEPTGRAKITAGYNLPCKYVLHTVGPVAEEKLTERNRTDLADCYRSCLTLADKNGLDSIAFCCISTGEFRFPNSEAAKIAVRTVKEYKRENRSRIKVIFNVFKEIDYEIYSELLGTDK